MEGDTGFALAEKRGRVPVVYRYRDLKLASGAVARDVLVGGAADSDEILLIPPQSTPKIRTAREKNREKVLSVRIPCELDDVLWVISDHLNTNPGRFTSALLRYYLSEAWDNAALARRLSRLSASDLATSRCRSTLKLRCEGAFLDMLKTLGERESMTTTDAVRGAVLAAFEDVVEKKASRRARELRSIAAAV